VLDIYCLHLVRDQVDTPELCSNSIPQIKETCSSLYHNCSSSWRYESGQKSIILTEQGWFQKGGCTMYPFASNLNALNDHPSRCTPPRAATMPSLEDNPGFTYSYTVTDDVIKLLGV
jgi:hypothetical protein